MNRRKQIGFQHRSEDTMGNPGSVQGTETEPDITLHTHEWKYYIEYALKIDDDAGQAGLVVSMCTETASQFIKYSLHVYLSFR